MPLVYRKGKPWFRRLTHTIRNRITIPALTLEGHIWTDNGFKDGDTLNIKSLGKGKIIIEKYD